MTTVIADRLSVVKPSPSMAAKARVDALQAAGRSIVDFTIGEPDFDTPAHIVEAGVKALADGQTRYTAAAGDLSHTQLLPSIRIRFQRMLGFTCLRVAILFKLYRRFHVDPCCAWLACYSHNLMWSYKKLDLKLS